MGRLTKNTHRHERSVTNSPPRTGPRAGATRGGHGQDARGPHPFLGREGPEQHGHAHRGQHASADPLEDPEEDQLGETVGQTAEDRGAGEHGDGEQQHPFRPEAVAEPPGGGDEDGQADQVARPPPRRAPSPPRGTGDRWTAGPR